MVMLPVVGSVRLARIYRNVDLPAPLTPTTAILLRRLTIPEAP
jgi:hypothetical protein